MWGLYHPSLAFEILAFIFRKAHHNGKVSLDVLGWRYVYGFVSLPSISAVFLTYDGLKVYIPLSNTLSIYMVMFGYPSIAPFKDQVNPFTLHKADHSHIKGVKAFA